jgi:hypothetical protein
MSRPRAETQDFLLLRGPVPGENFEWVVLPDVLPGIADREQPLDSSLAQRFQTQLRERLARRAELQVRREEEALYADEEANRQREETGRLEQESVWLEHETTWLEQEWMTQRMREEAREGAITFLLRAVVLAFLAWSLAYVALAASHLHLAHDVDPDTLVQLVSRLIG